MLSGLSYQSVIQVYCVTYPRTSVIIWSTNRTTQQYVLGKGFPFKVVEIKVISTTAMLPETKVLSTFIITPPLEPCPSVQTYSSKKSSLLLYTPASGCVPMTVQCTSSATLSKKALLFPVERFSNNRLMYSIVRNVNLGMLRLLII